MKSKFVQFLLVVMLYPVLLSAASHKISGKILDEKNNEALIGLVVRVKDNPQLGTITDENGSFTIELPGGRHTLVFQHTGLITVEKEINTAGDMEINVSMKQSSTELQEIVVQSKTADQNVRNADAGIFRLKTKDMETIPMLFGEKDIIKTIQMTPGVKSAGEGNSGFYVRGGSADQNLILLDGASVYNASHMLGFFSVFNSDAISEATIYKGSFPAEFGGRSASVLDVKMRDGDKKHYSVSGGLGTISSRLTVEGPLNKEKGSFLVSGRRTYADLFLKLSDKDYVRNSKLHFWDLNLKANYELDKKNHLYLSGYYGRDVFGYSDNFSFNWGNLTGFLRWNHAFNNRLFSNTSIILSNYDYNLEFPNDKIVVKSRISDINLKEEIGYQVNDNNQVKAGISIIHHSFIPGELKTPSESQYNSQSLSNRKAIEGAVYIQNDMKVSDRVILEYGIRYSAFNLMGAATVNSYNESGEVTDTKQFGKGETISYQGGFEPRVSGRYSINEVSSVKLSYNRMYQYMHLLSNSTTSSPTDLWVPSSNNIKPTIVDQAAIGYFRNFSDNQYEFSAEVYYKTLDNEIDYRPGADMIFNEQVEAELVYGNGKAYGMELLLRKQTGRLTGWVSYTLSRSMRKFDAINNGDEFAARQDRIHDLSVVAMYSLTNKLKLSGNWVYYTGNAATFPSGRYQVDGVQVPYYTERNGYRMPSYHRLDLGVTYIRRKTERTESSWNFSLYNAYGRENAYTINFRQSKDDPSKTEAVQTSLFRWIPSITYNFKF
jgi:hypothetical protein